MKLKDCYRRWKAPLRLIRQGLTITLMLAVFVCALLFLLGGLSTRSQLQEAKSSYPATAVTVRQITRADNSMLWYIAVLEEEPDVPQETGKPAKRNTIYASTVNMLLSEGDVLTMYVSPTDPNTRIVDFQTEDFLIRAGICGIALFVLYLFRLGYLLIRHQRSKERPLCAKPLSSDF